MSRLYAITLILLYGVFNGATGLLIGHQFGLTTQITYESILALGGIPLSFYLARRAQ